MADYVTTQGDMWDMIALKVYGSEFLMHKLLDGNPQYRHIVVFPANVVLVVPNLDNASIPVAAPVWKRGGG